MIGVLFSTSFWSRLRTPEIRFVISVIQQIEGSTLMEQLHQKSQDHPESSQKFYSQKSIYSDSLEFKSWRCASESR